MKQVKNVWMFVIPLLVLISACGNRSAVDAGGSDQRPGNVETTEPVVGPAQTDLEVLEQLVDSFVKRGLQVAIGGPVLSEYGFSVQATFLIIPEMEGESLLVFVFDDERAASAEAALVDPLGSSIGTTMASWISTPHFYQQGAFIVLYVGMDSEINSALEDVMGPQFAGG